MTIYNIIESIAKTSSTNEKKAIIERNKDNEVLKQVFFFAYNPRFNFWIKPGEQPSIASKGVDINLATLDSLRALIERKITGNDARAYFTDLMKPLTLEAREILCRVLTHDLRCGASDTLASKVWKNLVPEYPVMLASKYDEKSIKYLSKFENDIGFCVQTKADGGRLVTTIGEDGTVYHRSRAGNMVDLYGFFDTQLEKFAGYTIDGELIVVDENGVNNRQRGNGLYTKAIRGTISKDEVKEFRYVIWDIVPNTEYEAGIGTEPYETRLVKLLNANWLNPDIVSVIETLKVKNLEECGRFYLTMRQRGEEGAIIKVANSVFEDRRSKNIVKLKAEETGDFLCIGVEEGSGKYAGMIGSLICESSDGKVKFNVGTGLVDEMRMKDSSEFISKIIEVKYNTIIKSKNSDIESLFLPVYIQTRLDKKVANSREELS
jgi:ATP-dependent DNA ligase